MKLQISEIAKLTGVSIRTLHYYDKIKLLEPAFVDEQNGYRFYDERSLERMQEILFYRELDFPLKEIKKILSSPEYDKEKALSEQKKLLLLKKQRLERLINVIDNAEKGVNIMDFKAFDNSEYEKTRKMFAEEAKTKWGDTWAYKESVEKTSEYTQDKWQMVNAGMDGIIEEFARCSKSGESFDGKQAQTLVKKWQDYITKNYYTCTDEILSGLGAMYISDERFTNNIDRHGKGTAQFMSKAIEFYCK